MTIRFGTDGWRAIIAEDYTFANVRACAEALARNLAGQETRGVVVGFDTRFASDRFAAAVAEVLAAHDFHVWLCDCATPTPAVSYNVVRLSAAGGVVITASHNPAAWNGFKVKSALGGSDPPESVTRLEQHLDMVMNESGNVPAVPLDRALEEGTVEKIDAVGPYLDRLKELVDMQGILSSRSRVVVDSMFGAAGGLMPRLFAGNEARIVEMNGRVNPAFPGMGRPEPVGSNLSRLMSTVPELGADVGLAFDGDADRLGVVDENGKYLTTLEVFSLLAHHLLGRRKIKAPVSCTITMSAMVDKLGAHYGVPVHRTAVGFKYVGPKMLKSQSVLGGEESGGYALRGHVPERDGMLSGLLFIDAMVTSGKKPSELLAELHELVGPHAFDRLDLEFPEAEREAIRNRMAEMEPDSIAGIRVEEIDRIDGVRIVLEDGWWVVVRLSGTEPLIRLYAEGKDSTMVKSLLADLRNQLAV